MISKLSILIVVIFVFIVQIKANDIADDRFNEANELYQKGDFSDAIAYYEELIHNGFVSPELLYNLGNSYFKINKIPDAILNYERAKRLRPDDEDIKFNLKIANLKIVDKIDTVPQFFMVEWYNNIFGLFSSGTWSIFIIIFSWFSFAALITYFIIWNNLIRKISFFAAIVGFFIAISCLIFAFEQSVEEDANNEAIIFTASVYIKSSPDDSSTDLFILHEGTKVLLLDVVGSWRKIKLRNGNIGWLPDNTIEII